MDLEIGSSSVTELFNSLPTCAYSPFISEKFAPNDADLKDSKSDKFEMTEAKQSLLEAIYQDDKAQLLTQAKRLFQSSSETSLHRCVVSKLLHFCCASDSVECAVALVNGEFGTVPLVNEMDEKGWSALHTAAESHAKRCVELLLKKRGRTDMKTKDGRSLLALELSLSSSRMELIWNPDDYSIEDLVVILTEQDLTTVRLLSEKTKEIAEVAYSNAIEGRIIPLAALLIVAPEKVNESVLELRDAESGSKEKMTIYEGVIREALSLGREMTTLRVVKGTSTPTEVEKAERRKLLLREIELLQLYGAVASSGFTEKRVRSPLISACQAGDVAVIELLLKTNIDVNDTDAEGNSALHWSLKAPPQQIKIVWLLLQHGAQVSQKNKLGLTSLHVAAANGNSQALQVFLLEDPDAISYKTEMKETPLFFAVKNDHTDCTELLLRWGANSEVLNLRQRPIDLANSQDMRFMLNPTSISHMNRTFSVQSKYSSFQGDELISETCDALLHLTDEDCATENMICTSTKVEICKYFGSPRGCVRGGKCFYAHGEKELRQRHGIHDLTHSPTAKELRRKIYVGGLPPTLDSDSLGKVFEKQFGAVEDATVLGIQAGNEMKSRGFGFVTFKQETSASAAVETHYVMIMGKQAEIKSVFRKCFAFTESQKLSAEQYETQAESPNTKITEEAKLEQTSWVDRLRNGQHTICPNELQEHNVSPTSVDQSMPAWLRIFKKWLPRHLQDQTTRLKEGDYALSSLKGDFRATFGLELDHASLGYSKLSDFMKSLPGLCRVKVVPIGKCGPATHLVLLPNLPMPQQLLQHTLTMPCTPSLATTNESDDSDSNNSNCLQNLLNSWFCENDCFTDSSIESANPALEYPDVILAPKVTLPGVHLGFLQFLKPDPLFHGRSWQRNERDVGAGDTHDVRGGQLEGIKGKNLRHQKRHLVLEVLARKRNSTSVFFLGDFDFYKDYRASIKQGKCFACNQQEMLWANFPCRHLLWCSDCKWQAIVAAGDSEHKCVVCHVEVQKIDLLRWHESCQPASDDVLNAHEFPAFDPIPTRIRSTPSTKKKSPVLIGS
ncbi:hypothetical protein F2P56_000031 [Juglans regia]|uniref:Uncharacterized protein LOC109013180 isoform X2 n=2 Tax=Juglans regia TaxID=51240 RepID=A0A2I4H3J7_JUGRE|nr:uncharacterized protein LOC109013180 isoform X2 [Juglans regia]KAF5479184.1 hypothetical protein F2P56_000031 [Juglans regia]